ncbi:peptide chain release factor N(5)-glutamine methyltransferase [Candidatus Peregrinibacteria bacterium]|jgi:release factor glutamine methyltransferase|nr:peptide chain release factor N(5)-glutamine methyltransferase [Candidatus Peregrinibacteria bacterium]MBT4632169.1 peptide chain release factor N(5)-glutamine methyltransferase [Candidatus Peregrinibacteria bacterium]MBT5516730.1 peptide chain release factor N(5)-glutamine methyltransferase [Candidatus Peregrinibacteria bacterium]MBT5824087.1 peptide chain release factor N(5)-glutamine methyltransferase [Candidatus Peregrinibacteria bacterium]
MNVGRILEQAQKEELRVEMEVFLSALLDTDRLQLLAHPEVEIPVDKLGDLQIAWTKIKEGVPVAYLINEKEFYGLNFYVDERVLVPRGETERLVDYILDRAHDSARVLELGTGSGAIAVSLKKTKPKFELTATDVSKDALKVATKNCALHDVDLTLLESDLLEKVPHEDYDVLVANLPYIGVETNNFISENVKQHEPHTALFGGSDGLALYEKLFKQINDQERAFKLILGEIGFTQGRGIEALARKHLSHYEFSLCRDYQDLDRHFILERK